MDNVILHKQMILEARSCEHITFIYGKGGGSPMNPPPRT